MRWSIVVRDDVDKALRAYLGRRGTKEGDLSQFVEEAVQAATVRIQATHEALLAAQKAQDETAAKAAGPKL